MSLYGNTIGRLPHNDSITLTGGGSAAIDATLGEGPYVIEFTEDEDTLSASGVTYDSAITGLTATNIQGAIDELFTSVSDGKTLVASAITDKGITTANDATFEIMAENIGNIETGVDTSDATATASDICEDKTAYINGEKVTGSLIEYKDSQLNQGFGSSVLLPVVDSYTGYFTVWFEYNQDTLQRQSSMLEVHYDPAVLGDATASDVVAGKKFTSSAGVKVTGTLQTQTYYYGQTEPPNDLGNDYDLYFVME